MHSASCPKDNSQRSHSACPFNMYPVLHHQSLPTGHLSKYYFKLFTVIPHFALLLLPVCCPDALVIYRRSAFEYEVSMMPLVWEAKRSCIEF